jgi:hypothetical protein
MEPAEIVSRILQSARGQALCDACLAFTVEIPLAAVQAINSRLIVAPADYVRYVGPCESCGRVTAATAFVGAASNTDEAAAADRQRKCVRCSRRVTKDDEHVHNGDLFHRQCWAILRSQAEIANSRQMLRLTRAMIRRSRDRIGGGDAGAGDAKT